MTGQPSTTTAPMALAILDGGVLVRRPAVPLLIRAVELVLRERRLAGAPPPPWVRELRAALHAAAATSPWGSPEVPHPVEVASLALDDLADDEDTVTTTEAAAMLACTTRNVRDLHARGALLGGRMVAGRYLFDRRLVEAEALRRLEAATALAAS